jgi:hypothetical protein
MVLSLLSTQEISNGYKETVISVNLTNTFAQISPGVPWVQDLQSVLSSPSGVSVLISTASLAIDSIPPLSGIRECCPER